MHINCPQLESERLNYIPLSSKFVSERYVSWLNDDEVTRFTNIQGETTRNTLKLFLTDIEHSNILFWAILKKDGTHIGNIKIDPINKKNRTATYSILIGDKSTWGNGYAKEATLRILNYCFETLNLRKIILGVVEDNIPAVKLYEKLDFEVEGIFKKHSFHNGRWCDVVRMAKFNPEINE